MIDGDQRNLMHELARTLKKLKQQVKYANKTKKITKQSSDSISFTQPMIKRESHFHSIPK